MKTFVNAVVFGVFALVPATFAGEGHSHGGHSHGAGSHSHGAAPALSEARVIELANAEVQGLVKIQKLEGSWGTVAVKKASQNGPMKHWVVQYENGSIADESKKNLYVILGTDGAVKAVNFKGVQKPHSHGGGTPHVH